MAEELGKDPQCSRDDAVKIVRRLVDAGHIAYFAGGCVRDLLLGLAPKDYDVATNAPPARVRELFRNTQAVGAAFGVILVREANSVVEVATFRSDGQYLDGRRPSEVHFTTAEEDAQRRDFTINGLFLDPLAGKVIDFVNGQEDLQARRIRAIGTPSERFDEDSLRLLRAVRLSARLGFDIEPRTADAIRSHAPQLRRVSPERIAEELRRMLTPASRVLAWELLWNLKLTPELFRFLHVEPRADTAPSRFSFASLAPGRSGIAFGAALATGAIWYQLQTGSSRDVRELFAAPRVIAAVGALRKSLKISNDETATMRATLDGVRPLLGDSQPGVAAMKRFLAGPEAHWSRALLEALAQCGYLTDRVRWLQEQFADLEKEDVAPPPLIDGDMLTAAGLVPSPMYRRILDAVYDAQLEHRVKDRGEAMAMAMDLAARSEFRV